MNHTIIISIFPKASTYLWYKSTYGILRQKTGKDEYMFRPYGDNHSYACQTQLAINVSDGRNTKT
jgi:hypothetical protein